MSRENIPAGYQLHVTSWENDADVYKTQVISGLTRQDVNFYIDLASHFENDRGYGGEHDVPNASVVALVELMLKRHPNVSPSVRETWDTSEAEERAPEVGYGCTAESLRGDWIREILCDTLIGWDDTVSEYVSGYFRVVESFKVYYIPEEIQDVTKEFV